MKIVELAGVIDFFVPLCSTQRKIGWNKRSGSTNRLFLLQQGKEQQITSVLTTPDKKIKNLQQKPDCLKQEKKALMQQRLRVNVDSR